jgi:N-sulfoglucosamine sulfohydrolase
MHTDPPDVFPYTYVQGFERYCVKEDEQKEDVSGISEFMSGEDKDPFCLFVCSTNPHAPWTLGDASVYPPDELDLPLSLGDTPAVREAYSRYLAELTYFDRQVGEILKVLEETGKDDNTLVMLSTEQGWQFSGGKWTNWDPGVHTALIARWPGKIKEGSETDALVQYADIAPTLFDIAGGGEIEKMSGTSFLKVLRTKSDYHRDYVYCMHNNVPEGRPYPIRSVINKDYHLIMNLTPDSMYYEKHIEGGAHGEIWWEEWVDSGDSIPRNRFLADRFHYRPAVELYSVKDDPLQQNNLAGKDEYETVEENMIKVLKEWMKTQNDPGIDVDTREAFSKKYWDGSINSMK